MSGDYSPKKAPKRLDTLRLTGFNNLTKSLSFNLYDVCYAKTADERAAYIAYIDEEYKAERLTQILEHTTELIGATILNIARQDYEPQGASVTMLIAEGPVDVSRPQSETVVAHLDKSHICVHTYPESHPDNGIATFRADIEVSTCGELSPLLALNYLIDSFEADVLNLDYRVRGFTRDVDGVKHWIDHEITSIQNFVDDQKLSDYHAVDVNVYQENLFHTKMMYKDINLDRYVFGESSVEEMFSEERCSDISQRLQHEIQEIFYSRNLVASDDGSHPATVTPGE